MTRLDRLARSPRDLLDIAERIQAVGAGLRSLAEPWADTPFISPALDQAKMEGKGAKCSTSDYQRKDPNASWKMACDLDPTAAMSTCRSRAWCRRKKMTMDFLQHVVHEGEPGTVKVLTTATFGGECTSEMPVQ